MPIMIFALLAVLVLAVVVIAVVVMGMEGTGREKHPEIAHAMARTARHLNGEGEPPKALLTLFDEIDEVPQVNVRDLPSKLRSMRSARSATSAASADLPEEFAFDADAAWARPGDAAETPGEPSASGSKKKKATKAPVSAADAAPEPSAALTDAELDAHLADRRDDVDPDVTVMMPDPELADVTTRPEPAADDDAARPVQRSGKRKRHRNKGGRPAAPEATQDSSDEVAEPPQPRPTVAQLEDEMAAALSEPAVADLQDADPYGVWGADELDHAHEPAQPRIHLGRSRR